MFLSGLLNNRAVIFALIIFSVALAGCGGGGGGGSDGPPREPANLFNGFSDVSASEVRAFETEEYQNQPGLGMINAAWAYARGAANMGFGSGTGAGVTIGIIDSGLDTTYSDFSQANKVDLESILTYPYFDEAFRTVLDITSSEVEQITRYPVLGCSEIVFEYRSCFTNANRILIGDVFLTRDADGSLRQLPTSAYVTDFGGFNPDGTIRRTRERGQLDHGTFVSSIAAGARGEGGGQTEPTHGVAYNAQLRVHATDLGRPIPPIPGRQRPPYAPVALAGITDDPSLASFARFQNGAADVVNISINYSSDPGLYQMSAFQTQLRSTLSQTIAQMTQSRVDPEDRTIYVVAAGNAAGRMLANGNEADASSPEILAILPFVESALLGNFLAVVSVSIDDGEISFFSNRCGLAAAWCIAAPGENVRGAYSAIYTEEEMGVFGTPEMRDEETHLSNGTSFAAPHVTGAIAVLIDFFGGQLGNTQIVRRLLVTANKSGIYANQAIYGQGLLDLRAATEPFGMTMMLTGTDLSGPSVAASATRLLNGAAFGDAWTNAFRDHVLSVFDELDAPFPARLTDFVSSPARGLLFDAALSQLGRTDLPHHRVLDNGVNLSFSSRTFLASGAVQLGSLSDRRRWFASYGVHPGLALSEHAQGYSLSPTRTDEFLAPWLGFATDGLSVGAMLPFGSFNLAVAGFDGYQTDEFEDDRRSIFNDSEEDHRSRNQGFVLNLTSFGSSSWFGFQLGLVNEASGLVGSSGVGALKLGENMQTWFAGGTTGWTLGSWQAVASAYVGVTQPDAEVSGSLFVDMSSLISSTMSFGVRRAGIFSRGDRFSLFITQPLRVESGDAQLRFAVARTRYGDVILSETQADLAPTGREIEIEASYFYPLSRAARLTLAAGVIRDRGHEAGAPFETRWMVRWQLKF